MIWSTLHAQLAGAQDFPFDQGAFQALKTWGFWRIMAEHLGFLDLSVLSRLWCYEAQFAACCMSLYAYMQTLLHERFLKLTP